MTEPSGLLAGISHGLRMGDELLAGLKQVDSAQLSTVTLALQHIARSLITPATADTLHCKNQFESLFAQTPELRGVLRDWIIGHAFSMTATTRARAEQLREALYSLLQIEVKMLWHCAGVQLSQPEPIVPLRLLETVLSSLGISAAELSKPVDPVDEGQVDEALSIDGYTLECWDEEPEHAVLAPMMRYLLAQHHDFAATQAAQAANELEERLGALTLSDRSHVGRGPAPLEAGALTDYMDMLPLPGAAQLAAAELGPRDAPVNYIDAGAYADIQQLIGVHFRLLRADVWDAIFTSLREVRDPSVRKKPAVFTGVHITDVAVSRDGVFYELRLDPEQRLVKHVKWELGRRLAYSRLILLATDPGMQDIQYYGVIREGVKSAANPRCSASIFSLSGRTVVPQQLGPWCIMEVSVMYDVYKSHLQCLRDLGVDGGDDTRAFWGPLLDVVPPEAARDAAQWQFLRGGAGRQLDISCLYSVCGQSGAHAQAYSVKRMQELHEAQQQQAAAQAAAPAKGKQQKDEEDEEATDNLQEVKQFAEVAAVHVDASAPTVMWNVGDPFPASVLGRDGKTRPVIPDATQSAALQHMLASRVGLVQGPPGTGKSFTGWRYVQLLLENRRQLRLEGPILVLSCTNHAVDQFALDLLQNVTGKVCRLGRRSKDPELQSLDRKRWTDELGTKARGIYHLIEHRDELIREMEYGLDAMQFIIQDPRSLEAAVQAVEVLYIPGRISAKSVVHHALDIPAPPRKRGDSADSDASASDDEFAGAAAGGHADEFQPVASKKARKAAMNAAKALLKAAQPSRHEAPVDGLRESTDCLLDKLMRLRTLAARARLLVGIVVHATQSLRDLSQQASDLQRTQNEIFSAMSIADAEALRKLDVIAATMSGAILQLNTLREVRPSIIVVEEAGEALEADVLAMLNLRPAQLVLIGDHQQLPPKVESLMLRRTKNAAVSMFQRLVEGGAGHQVITTQRRMRPEISQFIRLMYPGLEDHDTCLGRSWPTQLAVPVRFMQIYEPEQGSEMGDSGVQGHANPFEAQMAAALAVNMLQNAVPASRITLLTPYIAQRRQILTALRAAAAKHSHLAAALAAIRLTVVDDYQGEENDVIVLSLTRSAPSRKLSLAVHAAAQEGKFSRPRESKGIGFLKDPERANVALSRARDCMIVLGNFSWLACHSQFWRAVWLRAESRDMIHDSVPLHCARHLGEDLNVKSAAELADKMPDGGCHLPCGQRLPCGHACERLCHQFSHDTIKCTKSCARVLPCSHPCKKRCYEPCGACKVKVAKELPCGHSQRCPCNKPVEQVDCTTPCDHMLPCGHTCPGTCHTCSSGTHKECARRCERLLICGHECGGKCGDACTACSKTCVRACEHSACNHPCAEVCVPCAERCALACEHSACTRLCGQPCDRAPCDEPCTKLLACGHRCRGLCGEICPAVCVECGRTGAVQTILGDELEPDVALIQLDCAHVFSVEAMDGHIRTNFGHLLDPAQHTSSTSVTLPTCMSCRAPVMNVARYQQHVKAAVEQINQVRQLIIQAQQQRESIFDTTRLEFARWQAENHPDMKDLPKSLRELPKVLNTLIQKCLDREMGWKSDAAVKTKRKLLTLRPDLLASWQFQGEALAAWANVFICVHHLAAGASMAHPHAHKLDDAMNAARPLFTGKWTSLDCARALLQAAQYSLRQVQAAHQRTQAGRRSAAVAARPAQVPEAAYRLAGYMGQFGMPGAAARYGAPGARSLATQGTPEPEAHLLARCRALMADPEPEIEQARALHQEALKHVAGRLKELCGREFALNLIKQLQAAGIPDFGRGHWYKCANCGEYFAIGECGGAMQVGNCINCKREVGGTRHTANANSIVPPELRAEQGRAYMWEGHRGGAAAGYGVM